MLLRIVLLFLAVLVLCPTGRAAAARLDSLPPTRWTAALGTSDRVSVGLTYQQAVLSELAIPTAEVLFRPWEWLAVGYRRGRISTGNLPALFDRVKGVLEGAEVRLHFAPIHFPSGFRFDFYLSYLQQRGRLPFDAELYFPPTPGALPGARLWRAMPVQGAVTFRHHELHLGLRTWVWRFAYFDISVGYRNETFRLSTDGQVDLPSVPVDVGIGPNLFGSSLPANTGHWRNSIQPRVGLGVRF